MGETGGKIDWRTNGVRIVKGSDLDLNTAADPGHDPGGGDQPRPRRGEQALGRHGQHRAERQDRRPPPRPPREHHLRRARAGADALGRAARVRRRGRARATSSSCRPTCPTRRSTPLTAEPLECVLVRSDQEAVVVNLDIEPAETVEEVWIDPNHPAPGSRR